MSRRAGSSVGLSTILLIGAAVICFAIVAFGINIDLGGVSFAGLGLALFAASFIFS